MLARKVILWTILLAVAVGLSLLAGCGGGDEVDTAATEAAIARQAMVDKTAQAAALRPPQTSQGGDAIG